MGRLEPVSRVYITHEERHLEDRSPGVRQRARYGERRRGAKRAFGQGIRRESERIEARSPGVRRKSRYEERACGQGASRESGRIEDRSPGVRQRARYGERRRGAKRSAAGNLHFTHEDG